MRAIWLLIGIDGAEARFTAPDSPRHRKGAIILRNEQCERGPVSLRPHIYDRLASKIDVDVGRGQQNIADLWGASPISDGHLAQRLQGERIPHGMSQDRNLADRRIACESLQYVLQRIPRIRGTLTVVAVGKHATARRPCEENRYDVRICVVHNLREAKDRIIKAVVETMNEDKHLPSGNSAQAPLKPGNRLRPIDHVGLEGDEVGGRITGHLSWPLHLANLPCFRRWERDGDIGKRQRGPACARKQFSPTRTIARGGNEHIDPAGVGHRSADRQQYAWRRGGARGQWRDYRKDQGQIENAVATGSAILVRSSDH